MACVLKDKPHTLLPCSEGSHDTQMLRTEQLCEHFRLRALGPLRRGWAGELPLLSSFPPKFAQAERILHCPPCSQHWPLLPLQLV